MDHIVVGSTNPVKFRAAKTAARKYWPDVPVTMFDVDPLISKMPLSKAEVRIGAQNRAKRSRNTISSGLGIGMEGGVVTLDDKAYLFSATFVTDGELGVYGGETLIPLPQIIFEKLQHGLVELGDVMDEVSNQVNTKQKQGAVGYLTNNIITRFDVFYNSVVMALVSWNSDLLILDKSK